MQTGCRDGPHPPVSLRHELLSLIATEHLDDHLLSVDVCALDRLRLQLCSLFVLLLDSLNFLFLDVDRGHFHAEDYILDLALGQTGDVDVVLLRVIGEDEVFEFYFDLDPLLVGEVGPDVVREGHCRFVGF